MINLFLFSAILTLPCYALLAVGLWGLRRAIPDERPLLEPLEIYLWAIAALLALVVARLLAPIFQ